MRVTASRARVRIHLEHVDQVEQVGHVGRARCSTCSCERVWASGFADPYQP